MSVARSLSDSEAATTQPLPPIATQRRLPNLNSTSHHFTSAPRVDMDDSKSGWTYNSAPSTIQSEHDSYVSGESAILLDPNQIEELKIYDRATIKEVTEYSFVKWPNASQEGLGVVFNADHTGRVHRVRSAAGSPFGLFDEFVRAWLLIDSFVREIGDFTRVPINKDKGYGEYLAMEQLQDQLQRELDGLQQQLLSLKRCIFLDRAGVLYFDIQSFGAVRPITTTIYRTRNAACLVNVGAHEAMTKLSRMQLGESILRSLYVHQWMADESERPGDGDARSLFKVRAVKLWEDVKPLIRGEAPFRDAVAVFELTDTASKELVQALR
jgi:hypothetical protein